MDKRFFKPTGLNQSGQLSKLSFHEYQDHIRNAILHARAFVSEDHAKTAALCAPFEWKPAFPTQKGVLLIHGLLDTPFITRDLATFFVSQGFCVRSILLPGHGTVPADLTTIKYSAWVDSVNYAIADFQKTVRKLYVGGFSLGGLLAINAALEHNTLQGLFLFVPANKIKSPLAPFAECHKLISFAIPRAKWLTQFNENDPVRYQSIAINGGAQVYHLAHRVKQKLSVASLKIPLFMALTMDDETVDPLASLAFFQKQSHPNNQALLFTNNKNHYGLHNVTCVASAVPDENIIHLSHTGIGVSPNNLHYGAQGDYTLLCRQKITASHPQFGAIYDADKMMREPTGFLKKSHPALYRLHYNPHFDQLTTNLKAFLMSL